MQNASHCDAEFSQVNCIKFGHISNGPTHQLGSMHQVRLTHQLDPCIKLGLLMWVEFEHLIIGLFLAFCLKFLGGGGNLRMVLCHSMNAGCMVGTLKPTWCNWIPLNFLHSEVVGRHWNIFLGLAFLVPKNHLVKLSQHLITEVDAHPQCERYLMNCSHDEYRFHSRCVSYVFWQTSCSTLVQLESKFLNKLTSQTVALFVLLRNLNRNMWTFGTIH